MRIRSAASWSVLLLCLTASSWAEDQDVDGIDDALERKLIDLYAPLVKLDVPRTGPVEGVGIPRSISRLIQHCSINKYVNNQIIFLYQPSSVDDALRFLSEYSASFGHDAIKDLSLRHVHADYMWGISNLPGGQSDWPTAISRNEGIYARVWRPWPTYSDIYSIQYYIYISYNDTDFDNEEGTHEGDWVAIDLAVDARANEQFPTILHMVLHVHGRDLFVTPEAIEFEQGHPVVYLENRVNEPWPNAGTGSSWIGGNNWPSRNGFAANKNFDFEDSVFVSESSITRDHTGAGNVWATWAMPVPNIGDNGVSLCGPEGLFLLNYSGRYGDRSEGIFYEGDPPKGPPYQDAFWKRAWDENQYGQSLGPWTGQAATRIPGDDSDPFQYPMLVCQPPPPASYSFCLWTSIGYSFAVPSRPAAGEGLRFWVVEGGTPHVEGSSVRPFGSFTEAVSRVPPGSRLVLAPGVSPFRGVVAKQLELRTTGGATVIGN